MAATATELTLTVVSSPITRPIIDGQVTLPDVRLRAQAAENIDNVTRRMLNVEYDVGEMSLATFIKGRAQGLPLVGLPLFTSGRQFPHRGMLVAAGGSVKSLSDLRGKRVAAPQYWFTPTVWSRWILQHEHSVHPADLTWVCLQPERFDPPGVPPEVQVTYDASGRSARELLLAGEVDASLGGAGGAAGEADEGRVVTIYPDPLEAQRNFYRRTGISCLQHVTVIREELAATRPDLVAALCGAYDEAKARTTPEAPAGMGDVLGDDAWPFGIRGNRPALEALVQAASEQGMISSPMTVEDLFASSLPERYR